MIHVDERGKHAVQTASMVRRDTVGVVGADRFSEACISEPDQLASLSYNATEKLHHGHGRAMRVPKLWNGSLVTWLQYSFAP
jgi:hypothetical protein